MVAVAVVVAGCGGAVVVVVLSGRFCGLGLCCGGACSRHFIDLAFDVRTGARRPRSCRSLICFNKTHALECPGGRQGLLVTTSSSPSPSISATPDTCDDNRQPEKKS